MENKKAIIFKILRILVISVIMCAVTVAVFHAYSDFLPRALADLEEEGKMENTIWVVEHFVPMLSIAVLIAALGIIYRVIKIGYSDMQNEKGFIMLVVAVFTYAVILPYVLDKSAGCFLPVPEGEEDVLSLLEVTASWFVIQIIPFMICISYHFVRSKKYGDQKDERGRYFSR
ncbi:MAG: hypothetical protein IJC64_01330 [Clostridia bacterium]|nr:hypothetical protein [Clostridia bacterium]